MEQAIIKSTIGTKASSGFELNINFKNSTQYGAKEKIIIVKIDWNKINFLTKDKLFELFFLFKSNNGVIALKKACSTDLKIANKEVEKVNMATASSPFEFKRIDLAKISIEYLDESEGKDSQE